MRKAPERLGVLCGLVPRELVEAAGFEARFVAGAGAAEALPANLCAHVRGAAAALAGPEGAALAGVVVADGCYPMLRLWDLLEASASLRPRWLLAVPRRNTPAAVAFFRGELERVGAALAAAAGFPSLDTERVAAAIEARNRWRERGRALCDGLFAGEIPRLNPRLLEALEGRDTTDAAASGAAAAAMRPVGGRERRRPRLLLVGSHFVTGDLLELIAEMGGDVCGVESCTHHRAGTAPVPLQTGTDPLRALAAAYLAQPPCPRMEAGGARVEEAAQLGRTGRIDGVVYLLMKSCTAHAYAVPHWRTRLASSGVPLLVLEIESADWSQPRLATRFEAFLESLARREPQ
ncbi:MAG TPA: 2-hydroxyacyl-CoA dehydratase family protein [bacterium]